MSDNPNQDICDMLIKLGEHERDVNGIIYKYHAYRKAAKALEAYGKRVKSGAEAQKLSGIGPKIAAKINDFLQNGCENDVQDSSSKETNQETLESKSKKQKKDTKKDTSSKHSKNKINIEASSANDDLIEESFDKIFGMTKIDVMHLKIKGIEKIGDLRNNVTMAELNEAQQICLEHYDDLRLKISRKEIKKFDKLISQTLKKLSNIDVEIEMCGQFRRRIEKCDQIDVLIIDKKIKSTDSDAEHGLKKCMKIIGKALVAENVIQQRLAIDGSHFVGIVKLEESSPCRLMNLQVVPKDQYVCALFHLTGSEQFWERIRLHCIDQGFILSPRSFCRIGLTLVPGLPIKLKSEEELFDYIQHPFVEPEDRQ